MVATSSIFFRGEKEKGCHADGRCSVIVHPSVLLLLYIQQIYHRCAYDY